MYYHYINIIYTIHGAWFRIKMSISFPLKILFIHYCRDILIIDLFDWTISRSVQSLRTNRYFGVDTWHSRAFVYCNIYTVWTMEINLAAVSKSLKINEEKRVANRAKILSADFPAPPIQYFIQGISYLFCRCNNFCYKYYSTKNKLYNNTTEQFYKKNYFFSTLYLFSF